MKFVRDYMNLHTHDDDNSDHDHNESILDFNKSNHSHNESFHVYGIHDGHKTDGTPHNKSTIYD